VAHKGITVNAVAPGMFATEMTDVFRADAQRTEWALSRAPQGRWGEPTELGGLVRYLASPAGAFVTGQILAVDGGWTA
jgi:2-deoxy-D-gluconate 3-dehydrogenase